MFEIDLVEGTQLHVRNRELGEELCDIDLHAEKGGEAHIVGHALPQQPLEFLDGVELRGVGRQENELHVGRKGRGAGLRHFRVVGGHVIEDDVERACRIFYREVPEIGAEVRRVNFVREEKVPNIARHVERAIDVHLLATPLQFHNGLLPAPPPHARDRGAPLEGAGIDEEEVVSRPRALDAGAQVVKEGMLLHGVSPGGHGPRAQRGKALAAERPDEGAGRHDLAQAHLNVVAGQLARPVGEGVPERTWRR